MKKIFCIALLALTCVFTVTAEPFKNDYFGKFTGAASSDFYGGYDVITSQVDLSDGGKIMSWNDSSYAFVESVSCEEMLNTITTNDMARLWIALMSCFSSGTGEVQDGNVTSVCLEAEINGESEHKLFIIPTVDEDLDYERDVLILTIIMADF